MRHRRLRRVEATRAHGLILVDGLRRLEYRGYDSAGVAVFDAAASIRDPARASASSRTSSGRCATSRSAGSAGIGHTRWATHGRPSRAQRAPAPRRRRRRSSTTASSRTTSRCAPSSRRRGRTIRSETDTEIIAHLIDERAARGQATCATAVRAACARVDGAYAIARARRRPSPSTSWPPRTRRPLVLGLGESETFLASDIPALLPYTRHMVFLEDGEIAVLAARTASSSSTPTAARSSASRARSTGTRSRPRRAATSTSCSRRSSSSRARSPTRSARACVDDRGRRRPRRHRPLDASASSASSRVNLVACGTPARLHGRQVPDRAARAHPGRGRSRQRVPLPRADPGRRRCW